MLFTDVQRSVRLNKKKKSTNTSPYPDEVIDRLARAFYPAILACWNSEEGQRSLVGATPLHLLSQTALPLKSPSGAFIAALRFANAVPPQTLLKTDEEELCQFDTIPPTIEKTERSRRGTPCCTYLCRMWIFQGASGWAHPIFVSSWLGVRQNASPQLLIGFFRHRLAPLVRGAFAGHFHC